MFDRYLTVVSQDMERYRHPLSTEVWGVLESSEATVEVQALVLAVAVESVLDRFYGNAVTVPGVTITAVDRLLEYLQKWDGDADVRSRAVGAVGRIKSPRAADRLKALVERGAVSQRGCDAWKKLRNTATHGDWSMVDDLQCMLDDINQVRVLFYQLVFHLIGYTGKQTDYGTHGWPLIDYPPHAGERITG
jgi:hypothetical protein